MATSLTTLRPQSTSNHDRHRRTAGLLATAALGLTLLAGGVIGQARPAAPPAAGVNGDAHVPGMWDTREDRRLDLLPAPFVADRFAYREDHRQAAVPAPATGGPVPDQFTYREDRRVELAPALAPNDFALDFFTYREDRRGGR